MIIARLDMALLQLLDGMGMPVGLDGLQAGVSHPVVMAFGVGVAAVLVLTPLVMAAARRAGWVDEPTTDRWHRRPVALMGGIAIVGGGALAVVLSGAAGAFPWPVWLGVALIFGAGWLDDAWSVPPEAKLAVQILSTVLLLYAGYAFWRGGPYGVSIPLTFLWVIGITNAVNLIDGLDGLAGGIAAIGAGVLGAMAWLSGAAGVATVAAAVAGSAGAFLVFNFHPARIFMGDCGSMTLGYVLAVLSMSVQGSGGPVAGTLVPVVVLAVPIFDTTFVTVTRILSGRSVSDGDVDHTHHRLALLGLSERRAVLTLHGVSLGFGVLALSVRGASAPFFYALVLLALVGAVVVGVYLASAEEYVNHADRLRILPRRPEHVSALVRTLTGAGSSWKGFVGMVADLILVGASFVAAYHLRFGGNPPGEHATIAMTAVPAVMGFKVVVFYAFRLYKGIWRHAGTPELLRLLAASGVASGGVLLGLAVAYGPAVISPAVSVIDFMITTAAVAGVRFGFRGLRQYFATKGEGGRRVLVYGTGERSLLAVRYLRQATGEPCTVVGLIDDAEEKQAFSAQGVSVLGTPEDLPGLCAEHDVDAVVLPPVAAARKRRIAAACREGDVRCLRFAPALHPVSTDPAAGDGSPGEEASFESLGPVPPDRLEGDGPSRNGE